jgi:hypothetical protein
MAQPDRAIQRTRAKRDTIDVIGGSEAPTFASTLDREFDLEVMDDTEFYHQLLQSFVESSGGASTSAAAHAARRKKKTSKEGVIRGASKGRLLRFQVHPLLVNFTEPVRMWVARVCAVSPLLSR